MNIDISAENNNPGVQIPHKKKEGFLSEIIKNKYIYLLALPGIIYLLLFNYIPMIGTVIAFKDYNIGKGIFASNWNGFNNFEFFFTSGSAWAVTRNTILLNAAFIMLNTILQVLFAILLNEIGNKSFKKICQSFMFLPYFMSWIVMSVIVMGFLESQTGTINKALVSFGIEAVNWYGTPGLWPWLLMLFSAWKWVGYGVVIYLAAISGFDTEYYEAATIDGASKLQQICHITLPMLTPTVIVLTLLSIGRIFYGDFGMIYGLISDNPILFPTTDVIDTYVFRALRKMSDFGMAAAIGLYQTVMGIILVTGTNFLARRFKEDGALF